MPLILLDTGLRGGSLALLMLLAGALLQSRTRRPIAWAGALMALGSALQIISSAPFFEAQVAPLWQAPWVAVSVGNAVLFWVFVRALFDDEFQWRWRDGLIWLAVAALSFWNCAKSPTAGASAWDWAVALQRILPIVFAALAAWTALSQWRADLVEARRRWRLLGGLVLLTGAAYSVFNFVARLGGDHGRLSLNAALLDAALFFAITLAIGWCALTWPQTEWLQWQPQLPQLTQSPPAPQPATTTLPGPMAELEPVPHHVQPLPAPPVPPTPAAVPDPADLVLAQALDQAMQVKRAYAREDLTVASLAGLLGVPEYRLRRHINQGLGYRNFNTYVNGFRLAEACAALADPQRRQLPVLSIALEAGFQSIGPFNRAFKAHTGLTPSDYRKQKLSDS